MNKVPLYIIIVRCVIIIALGVLGRVVQNRREARREKSSAYECGFDPNMSARIPFSLRFFLLAVILLVLDVEIALLMGAPVSLPFSFMRRLVRGLSFILILIIGLFHEWREGSLNWI